MSCKVVLEDSKGSEEIKHYLLFVRKSKPWSTGILSRKSSGGKQEGVLCGKMQKSHKGKCSRVELWGGPCVTWDTGPTEALPGPETDSSSPTP